MNKSRLSALEAETILILAHQYARAAALYAVEPFSDNEDAMKKAEKVLREYVYEFAQDR